MSKIPLIIVAFISIISWSCESETPIKAERIIIGVSADIENINPLFAFGLLEGNIREILFLGLVKHTWNGEIGNIESSPMLAEKWEWDQDSTSLILDLRDDVYWSDSTKFTAEDVLYSFDLYSDPEVQSTFYGSYDNLYTYADGHINIKKSFEVLSPTKIKIYFKPNSKPSLFDIDMPILQKRMFSKIPREDLNTTNVEDNLVTNGPYTLSSWKKNEVIILKAVPNSFLYKPKMSKEIIFKVVSDDNSRITQLKNNEIDLIEDVSAEAIDDLKKLDYIKIVTREGRDYDYIGWSNIDTKLYSSSQALNPNKFFGSSNVRKALSYAINREEILKENLHGYGQLSFGSVSPIFKSYYNNRLEPYEFNPTKAKQMLTKEGWIDRDQNGILEKNNLDFSFKLYIASGNPRRMYAATIVKNNLKAVGIDVTVETMEMGSFINRLFEHELDAFMAGWTVAIPIDLQPYWHSDFERSPFNLVGYSNPEVDSILNELENETKQRTKIALYKKIQELLHQDEPVTFLYWLNVITAYNKRITNITINPLGAIQLCWEWRIND